MGGHARESNLLRGSVRMEELRALQAHLSRVVHHAGGDDAPTTDDSAEDSDASTRSGGGDVEDSLLLAPAAADVEAGRCPPAAGGGADADALPPTHRMPGGARARPPATLSKRVVRSMTGRLRRRVKRGLGGKPKRERRGSLNDFDFLEQEEEDHKESRSLIARHQWWYGVFFFSLVSFAACAITLWAPYPTGARMPTTMIAEMPWSDGCKGGLSSCICPRETICADDLPSMIFLTIARCSAWFDYPLYMVLFLSKANNLNNFLQKTALRCWINFSGASGGA